MLKGNSANNERRLLIETDLLLALISPGDRHHGEAKGLFENAGVRLCLSPYSLTELDLLIRAKEIMFTEAGLFYASLGNLLEYYDIGLPTPKPAYHGKAYELRSKHRGLTYFDSLHAAVGIVENLRLVSYDKEYAQVGGLKYSHPKECL